MEQNQPLYPGTYYTWEEYLKIEEESSLRYEYHDGQIVAMAGADNAHNEIAGNCYMKLRTVTKKRTCKTFALEVKLYRHNSKEYFYPDGIVTCQSFDLQAKNGVRSPLLVIEVLSKSTRKADFGLKMREYLKIPSLQHYLLIEQDCCWVQHYRRLENQSWDVLFYDELEQKVDIPELDYQLALEDIYEGIALGPNPTVLYEANPEYGPAEEELV